MDEKKMNVEEQRAKEAEVEAKRKAYIEHLHVSTRQLKDRMQRSEQLTADHFAFQVNATQV